MDSYFCEKCSTNIGGIDLIRNKIEGGMELECRHCNTILHVEHFLYKEVTKYIEVSADEMLQNPELFAIAICIEVLKDIKVGPQKRVVRYLIDRFDGE